MNGSWLGRLLGWNEVDVAAEELAARFERMLPLTKAASERELAKALDALAAEAKGLKRKRRWGFIKSTRLGHGVRWCLQERGYSEGLSEQAARTVAVAAAYAVQRD